MDNYDKVELSSYTQYCYRWKVCYRFLEILNIFYPVTECFSQKLSR
jgi:hypothetical protein